MIDRLRRARIFLKTHGVRLTADKVVRDTTHYALSTPQRLRYMAFQHRLKGRDASDIFVEIYERNLWESAESRSGIGSEAAATANLRKHLPAIFDRFKINSVFDAPCGDFNWMRLVPLSQDMSYIGWDIVPAIIRSNTEKYSDAQRRFAIGNILIDQLPRANMMICRDCLFHFSHSDIRRALENFVASETRFLFTTSHTARDSSTNTDIHTGYFRRIDLFAEPFCFPTDTLYRVEDFAPGHLAREMCLWDRSQVERGLAKLTKFLGVRGGSVPA
jgi:hypothetical protein